RFLRDSGVDFVFGLVDAAFEIAPVIGQLPETRNFFEGDGFFLCGLEFGAHFGSGAGGIDASFFGVKFPEGRMSLNFAVAQRLRNCGVVNFAVAVAAIADEINHDGTVEGVAIFDGDSGDADNGVGIFGVDMKNRDGQALHEIGSEARRLAFGGDGGEADEIVENDVNAAAGGVAVDHQKIQSFGAD